MYPVDEVVGSHALQQHGGRNFVVETLRHGDEPVARDDGAFGIRARRITPRDNRALSYFAAGVRDDAAAALGSGNIGQL